MKKIIRLTESDLVRLVKRVIKEQGTSTGISIPQLPQEEKAKVSKEIWNKISHSPELKQHLEIMPHHKEHNFLDDVAHKLHIHIDPKTQHANIEFPGLGKQHNISLNLGFSYDTHHYGTHHDSKGWKDSVGNVGVKYNFGGGHKKEQPKPMW